MAIRLADRSLWPESIIPDIRAKASRDLFFFCKDLLHFTLLEEEPHGKLCQWLLQPRPAGEFGVRKRLVLMPRTTFKTSIITVGRNLQEICGDPNVRVLIDSDLRANSKKVASAIRWQLESNPRLQQLYGNLVAAKGWTEDWFTVPRTMGYKEPTVMTGGMDQVVVMLHFRKIYGDDLVNHTNVNTKEQLEKTFDHIQLYEGLTELSEAEPAEVEILLTGTRWDDNDAYMRILRSSGLTDAQIQFSAFRGLISVALLKAFCASS